MIDKVNVSRLYDKWRIYTSLPCFFLFGGRFLLVKPSTPGASSKTAQVAVGNPNEVTMISGAAPGATCGVLWVLVGAEHRWSRSCPGIGHDLNCLTATLSPIIIMVQWKMAWYFFQGNHTIGDTHHIFH